MYCTLEKAYFSMAAAAFTDYHPDIGVRHVDAGLSISPVQVLLDHEFTEGLKLLDYLRLHLKSERDVLILNPGVDVFPERCSFYVEAYSKMGAIHSGPIGDFVFPKGAAANMRLARRMVRTGRPPAP